MEDDAMLHLPIDIIYKLMTHISDPASLARLASSCKFWRNLIKDSTCLECLRMRHRDHDFTPSLLLGFFYQDNTESPPHLWQHHKDKYCCLAPSFMPMSELSQFIGTKARRNAVNSPSLGTFIQGLGPRLNFYEPVASQDSFLALRGPRGATNGQLKSDLLCVCNALTGEKFDISYLGAAPPQRYALFVTNDVCLDGRMSQSFQLVAIWIDGRKFICLCYSSKTGQWTRPPGAAELLPSHYLAPSPPASSHGATHWLCGSWENLMLTHVATLHIDTQELSYLELPPEAKRNKMPLLANSANGGLLLLLVNDLQMSLWKHSKSELGSDTRSWVLSESINMTSSLPLRVVKMQTMAKVRLEMFQGRSGTVVFWVEGEGLFLFSLSDRSMRKIESERVTKKYSLCPYEIDWLSCLAVTNLVVDGSLSADMGRKKVQGRWRTLMARNMASNRAS